ncbi:MAG: methylenetetrahydrofolate--tRNA-(uracil(54)-C(5))-methyltransferase (FADH(2)-oxidizing) TrmFO, partial [Myxococcota bacterium]
PIEVMAERGVDTLAFGPMKPVGLTDPRTGLRPHAVVQLRQEDQAQTAYNLVGFQTRLRWPEQKRIFRMIPGLEEAEFVRLGSVHRNTFVHSPSALRDELDLAARPGVYLAGQITGVEGYIESAAFGMVVGIGLSRRLAGEPEMPPPATTALGALRGYVRTDRPDFQPSNVVWSMFPPMEHGKIRGRRKDRKRQRHQQLADRALSDLTGWLEVVGTAPVPTFQTSRPAPVTEGAAE